MLLYYQFLQNRSKIKGINLREHPVFSAHVSRAEKKTRQLVKHMGPKNEKTLDILSGYKEWGELNLCLT